MQRSVYVFTCAEENVYGLSLQPGGRNLPVTPSRSLWLPHDRMPLCAPDLRRYTGPKTAIALIRLETGGYYVAEPEPKIVALRGL